jgi:hypothetical protein
MRIALLVISARMAHLPTYVHDLFSANNLPNILLFLAGLGGIAVGVYTLLDIREQTRLLGQYVAATNKSVDAAISSERAWVMPEVVPMAKRNSANKWCRWVGGGTTVLMSTDEILRGDHLRHGLKFVNMGRTVARISAYQIHTGLWDHKKGALTIQQISYNGDFDRMLAGGEATEVLADEIIDLHKFASHPAAEIDTWKNWLVVLVVVSYQHVFSGAEPETEVFRFVYNHKKMNVRRAATTEADKKQAREPHICGQAASSG